MKTPEEKDYIPFSKEWEKEMMKFDKKSLIELLRKELKTKAELKEEIENKFIIAGIKREVLTLTAQELLDLIYQVKPKQS